MDVGEIFVLFWNLKFEMTFKSDFFELTFKYDVELTFELTAEHFSEVVFYTLFFKKKKLMTTKFNRHPFCDNCIG